MLLLTGATGIVGSALLPKLLEQGLGVRCLVRDPRRLGAHRVHVQIALGDLADPGSFRNALRGVDTVVHLAASTRDEPSGTIEELCTLATLRLVQAAQRMDVVHFVFFSALGASPHHRVRLFRAKAVAERLVREAPLRSTVIAPSVIYEPGDRWLRLLERLAWGPVVPLPGSGRARCQPIWAQDVADCVIAALGAPPDAPPDAPPSPADSPAAGRPATDAGHAGSRRYELAGPETLTYDQMVRTVLAAGDHERRLAHLPPGLVKRALRLLQRAAGAQTPVTWDEAELLRAECVSARGPADARALGCEPQRMGVVLGLG